MNTEMLERNASNEFRSLKDPQLREIYRNLNNNEDAPRGITGPQLREITWGKYCAAIGRPLVALKAADKIEHPKPLAVPKIRLTDSPPSLTGNGEWAGRRRLVTLHPSEEVIDKVGKTFNVNGIECGLLPNVQTSVPWPIYQVIKRSVTLVDTVKEFSQQTGKFFFVQKDTKVMAYAHADHGDDPETVNKPTSLQEWYEWQCISNDYYKLDSKGGKTKREHLRRIMLAIDEPHGMDRDWLADRTDEELRHEVLERLGFQHIIRAEQDAELEDEEIAA